MRYVSLFLFTLSVIAHSAEEAIDLSSLGVSDFTPYLFDRNGLLILLPLLSLALVLLHLIPNQPNVVDTHTTEIEK